MHTSEHLKRLSNFDNRRPKSNRPLGQLTKSITISDQLTSLSIGSNRSVLQNLSSPDPISPSERSPDHRIQSLSSPKSAHQTRSRSSPDPSAKILAKITKNSPKREKQAFRQANTRARTAQKRPTSDDRNLAATTLPATTRKSRIASFKRFQT